METSMSKNVINLTEPHLLANMPPDTPMLVGLSGGADSTALLHLLCVLREKLGFELYAAHLNHGIRTEQYQNEADRDEEFCKKLCSSLGVKLFVEHMDIPALSALSGRSIETEAREARYSFFAKVMNGHSIPILVTAHNADDNFETQILNICRGCGTDGLCGIPKVRELGEVENGVVVRPILSLSKSEIFEYCRNNNLSYVTDSTNFEDDCTRNIIRHRVIPELLTLFPASLKSSARLSEHALEDTDYITGEAEAMLSEWKGVIKLDVLNALHPALKKRMIISAFSSFSHERLEAVHISSICELCAAAKERASLSLPDRMRAKIRKGELIFEKDIKNEELEVPKYDIRLRLGLNMINGTDFAVLVEEEKHIDPDQISLQEKKYDFYSSAELYGVAPSALCAKNRQGGDTIRDGGMSKKIKKLMCDKKVELSDRDRLPLIYEGEELIYAPLCAVCDRARTKQTAALHISIYKNQTEKKK